MQFMKKKAGFPVLYPNAAGIDIASREHYVAVNPDAAEQSIRSFGSFTDDLHEIAAWLLQCKVDTVAMEATVAQEAQLVYLVALLPRPVVLLIVATALEQASAVVEQA